MTHSSIVPIFFFFNDTATTEIYTLSLHDALPISLAAAGRDPTGLAGGRVARWGGNARMGGRDLYVVEADEYDRAFLSLAPAVAVGGSEEHTSELQSPCKLVCRLLLVKKKRRLRDS